MSAFADINVSAFVEATGQHLLTLSRRIPRKGVFIVTWQRMTVRSTTISR